MLHLGDFRVEIYRIFLDFAMTQSFQRQPSNITAGYAPTGQATCADTDKTTPSISCQSDSSGPVLLASDGIVGSFYTASLSLYVNLHNG